LGFINHVPPHLREVAFCAMGRFEMNDSWLSPALN
jgi:hypothetical protein